MAPVLWDAVRHTVDMRGETNQFILTGSAVPQDDKIKHTGTGRISRMLMRPMSLYESLDSNGSVSLKSLFGQPEEISGICELSIEKRAYTIIRGGWPASVGESAENAFGHAIDYVEAIINADISRVDGVERSPVRNRNGLEADAVICLRDGRWAAVEVKMGSKEIESASRHLLELKNKVNTDKMREPSFLMVLTATEFAYRREDGVYVVPIGCLKD